MLAQAKKTHFGVIASGLYGRKKGTGYSKKGLKISFSVFGSRFILGMGAA